jgi:transposase-like protein
VTTELKRRKKAVQLYYDEQLSKAAICRHLNCSRPWLDRWLKRYDPDQVEASLSDRTSAPKAPYSPWSERIRQRVLAMRRSREKQPYALIGAEAIHYELAALDADEVPPIRTIHEWLVQANLVSPAPEPASPQASQAIPLPAGESVNAVHCLDLKGPLYLQGSDQKYYLIALRDRYSRRCAIDVLDSRKAQGIINFLVVTWR